VFTWTFTVPCGPTRISQPVVSGAVTEMCIVFSSIFNSTLRGVFSIALFTLNSAFVFTYLRLCLNVPSTEHLFALYLQKRATPVNSATNSLTRDRTGSGKTKRPTEVVIPHDVTIESRSVQQVVSNTSKSPTQTVTLVRS